MKNIKEDEIDLGLELELDSEEATAEQRISDLADDAEIEEIAQDVIKQHELLVEIYSHVAAAHDAAKKYNDWLNEKEVQAFMSNKAEKVASMIKKEMNVIDGIV